MSSWSGMRAVDSRRVPRVTAETGAPAYRRAMATLSLADHATPAGVDAWLAAVGATPAPTTRAGARTALRFFAARMPTLPPAMALNFLAAMDLSRPVSAPTL